MKALLFSLLGIGVIAKIVNVIAWIWVIVEFLIYLVKDTPFNWWSVWTILISGGILLAIYASSAIAQHNSIKETRKRNTSNLKTGFQARMEQMKNERL